MIQDNDRKNVASANELESVLEGVDEGLIAFGEGSDPVLVNGPAQRLLGLDAGSPLEEIRRSVRKWEVFDEEGRKVPLRASPLERAARGETFERRLYHWKRTGSGEEKFLVCSCRLTERDPIIRILALHDVTSVREARSERDDERSERELAEQQFQAIFEANPAPTLIIDLQSARIEAGNPGAPEITGRSNAEVRGRSIFDLNLFHDVDLLEGILQSLRDGHAVPKTGAELLRQDGSAGQVIFAANPIELSSGPGAVITFVDITEQKEAELRFTTAFRLAPVPAVIVTLDEARIIDVNNAYLERFGRHKDEMVSRSLAEIDFWADEREASRAWRELETKGRFRSLELPLAKNGGACRMLGFADTLQLGGEMVALQMFSEPPEGRDAEEHLVKAIQAVMSDSSWFTRSFLQQLAEVRQGSDGNGPRVSEVELTRRENEVLERLARGRTTKEIARELDISLNTVRNYLSSIYAKLGVSSRAEAMIWARERGIGTI